MEDEKSLIRKYKGVALLLSLLFPMAGFLAFCKAMSITPFGDNTFLYEDMKQQYLDFYMYYKAVFKGADGFFYSDNCGLGSDMLGIWAYYLSSPLLVFLNFVPGHVMPQAITFFIMVKMMLLGFTSTLFLLTRLNSDGSANKINILAAPFFGMAFSLSGWVVANISNVMWLDAVIMMPVVLIFYERMLKKQRPWLPLYVLSVAVMIVCNYYISAMIMLLLGAFTIFLLLFKKINLKDFARFMYSSLAAVATDLWLLVPVGQSLLGSNKIRSRDIAEAFYSYLPTSEAVGKYISPLSVASKLFSLSYDAGEIMTGLPNIYSGIFFLVLAVLFFTSSRIDKKEKLLYLSFIAVITSMFCIAPFNKAMHGFTEAYGYLYRYSFVFSFVVIYLAFRLFVNLDAVKAKEVPGVIFGLIVILILCKLNGAEFIGKKALVYNIFVAVFSGIMIFAALYFAGKKKAIYVAGLVLMLTFGMTDMMANFVKVYRVFSPVAEKSSDYKAKDEMLEETIDSISDKSDYRVESVIKRSPNDSLHYNYKSITTYNSITKVEDRVLLYRMGFNDNGIYTEYDGENTRTADALLGIKYVLVPEDTEPLKGQEKYSKNIIENDYVLPADTICEKNVDEIYEYLEKEVDEKASPFDVQEAIWKKVTGSNKDCFCDADIKCEQNGDEWEIDITPKEDGDVFFYMNRDKVQERSFVLTQDGEFIGNYGNASCQKVKFLGYHEKGETIELVIRCADGNDALPSLPTAVTERIF